MYKTEWLADRDFILPESDTKSAYYFSSTDMQNIDFSIMHIPEDRDGLCIQAGGNLGFFPIHYAKRFQTVVTFEPDPVNFFCLTRNATEANIIKLQAALGNGHDWVEVEVRDADHVGQNFIKPDGKGLIPQMRIDDLQYPSCDLIQLDLEGFELFALQGAEQTIKKHRPYLSIEFGIHAEKYGTSNEQIDELLRSWNYVAIDSVWLDKIYAPC